MEQPSPTQISRAPQALAQTVSDALQVMQEAFRSHREIDVDESGTLKPGRNEANGHDFRQIFARLFFERADPAEALYEKMVLEVARWMDLDEERASYVVDKRVASLAVLRQATARQAMETIEERWRALAMSLSPSGDALYPARDAGQPPADQ